MVIGTAEVKIHIPHAQSLKEKRMVVKSIITKTRNKFNMSVAEVGEMDKHQLSVIGLACVSGDRKVADSMIQQAVSYVEDNLFDAMIEDIYIEII